MTCAFMKIQNNHEINDPDLPQFKEKKEIR
jgi:hypothetical protein